MVTGLCLGLEASPVPCNWATALRHDGGDAETGFGLDLGGGIALLAHANSRSIGEVGTFRGALD